MEYFWILVAFIVGVVFALSPNFLVIVKGEKNGLLIVEYKDEVYKLVKMNDVVERQKAIPYER